MKKLLIMTAMLFGAVLLMACEADTVPEAGVWNDDIYVNESLGIQFQLPHGWEVVEGEAFTELVGIGTQVLSDMGSDLSTNEILEAMEDNPAHDMIAMNPFSGSAVQVMFQRLPRSARNYSTEEVLDLIAEGVGEGLGHAFNVNPQSGMTTIGHYEFSLSEITTEIMGVEVFVQVYVRLEGRNVSVIVISTLNANELEDILYFFNEPGADWIEIAELEGTAEASDLIGTWEWDLDSDYVYIFNEDGTGVRGYADLWIEGVMETLVEELGQEMVDDLTAEFTEEELLELMMEVLVVEEFKWEFFDNVLHINFDFVGSFGVRNE